MKIFDPKLTGSIEIQNTITGDVTLSGNLIVDGNLQGAVTASATASYVDFDNIDSKPTLLSGSAQIASDISGSFTSLSSSVASGLLKNTTDTLTGDLTVTGTLTAQEFHTEFTSASVIYESGSTQFGNSSDDTHVFRGELFVSASDAEDILTSKNYSATDAPEQFKIRHDSGNVAIDSLRGNLRFNSSILILSGSTRVDNNNLSLYSDQYGNTGVLRFFGTDDSEKLQIGSLSTRGYIYTPAETDLAIFTNAVEKVRIDVSGSVGIGTTSPNEKLSVNGNIESWDTFILNYGNNSNKWQQLFDGSNSWNLRYYNGSSWGSSAIVVNTSNNVGIGTTSPSEKLHIVQNTSDHLTLKLEQDNASYECWFEANSQDGGYFRSGISTNANNFAFFNTDQAAYRWYGAGGGSPSMTLTNGNIGIGTTDPSDALVTVKGSGNPVGIGDEYGHTGIKFYGSTSGQLEFFNNRGNSTYGNTIFTNSSSESMRITSVGSVGIGTDAPGYKLDVNGSARVGNYLTFSTGTSIPSAALSYYTNGYIYLKGGGGGVAVLDDSGASGLYVNDDLSANININNSAAIKINTSSDVGIGTTSPTVRLDIADTSFGLPATSGTTPSGFMRIGYTDRTWGGNEILFGIINSGGNDYAGYIQSKVPTDYSQNRAFLINPQGGAVGINTDAPGSPLHVALQEGVFIRASNASSNVSSANFWGYGLYEGTSRLGEISLVRDGTSNQMYVGTTATNQTLTLGSGDKNSAIFIDGSGNVGINSTSPSYALEVQGQIANRKGLLSAYGVYTAGGTYTNQWQKVFEISYPNVFAYAGMKLLVTQAGDTSNVNMNAEVHINYKFQSNNGRINVNIVNFGELALTPDDFEVYRDGTNDKLVFYHRVTRNYTRPYYTLLNNSDSSMTWSVSVVGASLSSENNDAFTEKNITATINARPDTGNVGIGVTDPQAKLEVMGSSATPADGNETISVTNTTGGTKLLLGTVENSYGWVQAAEGGTARNLLLNPNNGNVGIGITSPQYDLHVQDSIRSHRYLKKAFYYQTTDSVSSQYFHIKTGVNANSNTCMHMYHIEGYAYGQGAVLNERLCFHTDSSGNIYGKSYDGSFANNIYKASDGYVVLVIGTMSTYYTSFMVNLQEGMYTELHVVPSAATYSSSNSGAY